MPHPGGSQEGPDSNTDTDPDGPARGHDCRRRRRRRRDQRQPQPQHSGADRPTPGSAGLGRHGAHTARDDCENPQTSTDPADPQCDVAAPDYSDQLYKQRKVGLGTGKVNGVSVTAGNSDIIIGVEFGGGAGGLIGIAVVGGLVTVISAVGAGVGTGANVNTQTSWGNTGRTATSPSSSRRPTTSTGSLLSPAAPAAGWRRSTSPLP